MMQRKAYPTDLTDKQWALIAPLVMQPKGKPGRPHKVDTRKVVNAILYVVGRGASGGCCPMIFRPGRRCNTIFNKWSRDGTWHQIHQIMAPLLVAVTG